MTSEEKTDSLHRLQNRTLFTLLLCLELVSMTTTCKLSDRQLFGCSIAFRKGDGQGFLIPMTLLLLQREGVGLSSSESSSCFDLDQRRQMRPCCLAKIVETNQEK